MKYFSQHRFWRSCDFSNLLIYCSRHSWFLAVQRVDIADLRLFSLERPADKMPSLASGNLDFGRVPTSLSRVAHCAKTLLSNNMVCLEHLFSSGILEFWYVLGIAPHKSHGHRVSNKLTHFT